jgi:hypothetical protein
MVSAVLLVTNIIEPARNKISESNANGLFVSLCAAYRAKIDGINII